MMETVDNLVERLKYFDVDELVDMLGIDSEELLERFTDKINVEELWQFSETPQSASQVDS